MAIKDSDAYRMGLTLAAEALPGSVATDGRFPRTTDAEAFRLQTGNFEGLWSQ